MYNAINIFWPYILLHLVGAVSQTYRDTHRAYDNDIIVGRQTSHQSFCAAGIAHFTRGCDFFKYEVFKYASHFFV